MKQLYWRALGQKYRTRHVMNSIVTPATIHLKKIAAKSQELGKQILRERVLQQIVSRRSKGFAFALCDILLAFRRHNFDGGATSGP
jgi:hypothetical protein